MNTTKNIIIAILAVLALISGIYIVQLKDQRTNNNQKNDNSTIRNTHLQEKQTQNDNISNSRKNIITETVKKVSPGVVGINVIEIQQYRNPFSSFFDDPFFRQFFGDRGNRSREIKELGSGYIISSDGYIVTNDHVAGNASKITVTLTNGNNFDAKLVGTDPVSDIALLKIDGDNLPHMTFGNSDDIMIGEWVIAFGNPFGLFEINDKPTVTVGVVSATNMNLEPLDDRYYLNMIQTDASINGGNSGGPLVNSLGQVIGMNTLIYTAGTKGSIGLGFAIPINKVKRIIDELKRNGKIDRNFEIGMRIQGIDENIARYYNLDRTRGVIITNVYPGTPADKAGLKVGDIILKISKYQINNEDTVFGVFFEFRTGQEVNLKIVRDGKIIDETMKLEPRR
jgi:serine protease Do